jgi:hypothetical protein
MTDDLSRAFKDAQQKLRREIGDTIDRCYLKNAELTGMTVEALVSLCEAQVTYSDVDENGQMVATVELVPRDREPIGNTIRIPRPGFTQP